MATINSPLPGDLLNREPYFEDYKASNNFYQVPFKSGLAPQARELTQLQTILQEQIGRFGNGIYSNGTPVIGSQVSITRALDDRLATLTPGIVYFNQRFLSVDNQADTDGKFTITLDTGENNFEDTVEGQLNAALTSSDTTMTLRSVDNFPDTGVVKIDDEYIYYSGVDTVNLQLQNLVRGYLQSVATAHIDSSTLFLVQRRTGKKTDGSSFTFTYDGVSVEDYVENPTTDDEYGTWFNFRNFQLGYKVTETIITASEDESLLDNSVGSANFNAPGADRLKIEVTLDFRPLNQEYSDFIFLLKYRNGNIIERKVLPQFSEEVNSYLSRQIEEVSGNFSVNPHTVSVLEWTPKELQADPTRSNTFAVNISSGKTYVSGYRRERLVPTKISMTKGYSNISQNYSGNGLVFKNYDSFTVDLSSPGPIKLNNLISITTNFGGAQTFYAWIRQIEQIGVDQYRVYFSDASSSFYANFSSGVSVSFYNSENPASPGSPVAEGTSTSAINFTDGKLLVYNTMPDAVNFSDLTGYTKSYQTTVIPGGTSTFTLNNSLSGEQSPSNANEYTVTSTIPGNELFVIDSAGNLITTGFTITNTGTNQVNFTSAPANDYQVFYRAYAFGVDPISTERTQLRNTQVSVSMPTPTTTKPTQNVDQFIGGGSSPGYYDVWKINSVVDAGGTTYKNGVDFILIDGQTPNYFYGSAIRWLKNRSRPASSYTLNFNYWAHQGSTATSASGSMITSDSFTDSTGASKDYLNISRYLGRRRTDFIDFRTRNNQVTIVDDVYTVGDPSQNTVDVRKRTRRNLNNESLFYDVQRYLPQWNTLFVDKQGEFTLLFGTPRVSPERPQNPDNTLLLANIYVPAYPRTTGDVKIEPFNSIRFKQSDIKKLETRVSNLETFVLSNKLELLALNQQLDEGETRRGIMVDDFSGHGIADVNNPEYSAAIDPIEGALRLPFTHEFHDLSFDLSNFDSVGSNILVGDKTVTLDFIEESYIENLNASGSFNVNPFDVFDWIGVMTLSPAVDIWVNTDEQPDILADHELQNSHFSKENPVTGWEREYNFWFRTPFGLNQRQSDTNTRFQSKPPVSITDSQVSGGLNVADKSDFVENELRNSSRAWNLKLTGFQDSL